MSDVLLMIVAALCVVTLVASVIYSKRIRETRQEYEEAKDTVKEIVVSFDRQFQKHEDQLLATTHKTEALSSESGEITKKMEEQDARLANLASRIEAISKGEQEFSAHVQKVGKELDETKEAQERLLQRIVEVEKARSKAPVSEAKIEAAIPIKKEKALAPLTETELNVLEVIAKQGEKTAPEIREMVKLTREHTARLMKKLYEDGYLERDTYKMPYTYRLKEEMQKILKKREAKA